MPGGVVLALVEPLLALLPVAVLLLGGVPASPDGGTVAGQALGSAVGSEPGVREAADGVSGADASAVARERAVEYAALAGAPCTRSTPEASRKTCAAGLACTKNVGLACTTDASPKLKAFGVLEPSLQQPRGDAVLEATLPPDALTPGEAAGGREGEMAAHDEPMIPPRVG